MKTRFLFLIITLFLSSFNMTAKISDGPTPIPLDLTWEDPSLVCISLHNKIPFIDNASTLYLQDELITGVRTFNSPKVLIGSDVTPLKSNGPVIIQSGTTTINAETVEIKNDTSVEIGSRLRINTGNNE